MYILAKYLALLDYERRTYPEGEPERAAQAVLRVWMMDYSEELAATGTEISRLLSA